MKKKILLAVSLMLVATFFSGCGKDGIDADGQSQQSSKTADTKSNAIVTDINQASQETVQVPATLEKCDPKYLEKTGDEYFFICTHLMEEHVCAYVKEVKGGEESYSNLEYNNECDVCQFYGETGQKNFGEEQHTLLGYEKKPCYQGMYYEDLDDSDEEHLEENLE